MLALLPIVLSATFFAVPQGDAPDRELDFEAGTVQVAGNIASMDLPEGWSYLQARDARYVLEEMWGNPPDTSVVGLVSPDDPNANWAIAVSLEKDGHVDDGDAAGIDYDDLLKEMKSGVRDANAERRKMGYSTVELVGWAEPPHYDSKSKKLYWARHLRFGDAEGDTLNYDVRVLGRDKVLVLSAIGSMDDLAAMSAGAKDILAVTHFSEGQRYEDYDPSVDKLAAYGIGGLIAGKVLAKVGFFALLVKGWKLLVVGAVAAFAAVKKFVFGKGPRTAPADDDIEPQPEG
ncbi:MAG: DUF2167 domain-containing protein [Planctomycetota bacterium]